MGLIWSSSQQGWGWNCTEVEPSHLKDSSGITCLTVGVVTLPFNFEASKRRRLAEEGIEELQKHVDTLIIIPNNNLLESLIKEHP